jgi:hypothetical protein
VGLDGLKNLLTHPMLLQQVAEGEDRGLIRDLVNDQLDAGKAAGLIQSVAQASLPGLSAWVEVGGIAPSLCLKAHPLQPIST